MHVKELLKRNWWKHAALGDISLRPDDQTELQGELAARGMLVTLALATPSTPTVVPVGTTGATNYGYQVVATVAGEDTAASAEGTTATGNAALSATNYNRASWTLVPGATGYKVYRPTGGATQGLIATITDGRTTSVNDTGLAGDGTTASSANQTGNIVLPAGKALRSGKASGDTILVQVYDVDGAAYTTFVTGTAGNTPSFTLASVTLTAPTINGTVATTGLTLPNVTLGAQTGLPASGIILGTATSIWYIIAGAHTSNDSYISLASLGNAATGRILFATYNGTTAVSRLALAGGAATIVATWAATNQAFGAGYLEVTEMAAPGAGAANTARIYALEGAGDALTDLAAVFQDGSIAVFAQETTPLDAPRFSYPDDTEVKMVLRKPHPGVVKFVAVFPDGREEVLNETLYTDTERVGANKGAKGPLPGGWRLETQAERDARGVVIEAARLASLTREKEVHGR